MTPAQVLVVAVAGAFGALVRAEVGGVGARRGWPVGRATLLVNLLGAALVGAASIAPAWSSTTRLGVVGGLLGGLTTFSTWMVTAVAPLTGPPRRPDVSSSTTVAGPALREPIDPPTPEDPSPWRPLPLARVVLHALVTGATGVGLVLLASR